MGTLGRPLTWAACGFTTRYLPNDNRDYVTRVCPGGIDGVPNYICTATASGDNRSAVAAILTVRSHHTGGVNASLLDGSVKFVSQTINIDVWRAVSTSAGGETATW
jgi:prepilin-type processing-associated H-X9-DG protein